MKSPWKLISSFVSRRAKEQHEPNAGSEQINPEGLSSVVPTTPGNTPSTTAASTNVGDAAVRASPPQTDDVRDATAEAVVTETVSLDKPSATPPDTETSEIAQDPSIFSTTPRVAPSNPRPRSATLGKSSVDDGRGEKMPTLAVDNQPADPLALDIEIRELRRRLSEKLAEQNAYLKQLLTRYD